MNTLRNIRVSLATKQLIDKLLLERISLRGIARVPGVSRDCLNDKMNAVSRQVEVSAKIKGRLTIEYDEMWSFIRSKKNAVYMGRKLTNIRAKLWDALSVIECENQPANYGLRCP